MFTNEESQVLSHILEEHIQEIDELINIEDQDENFSLLKEKRIIINLLNKIIINK